MSSFKNILLCSLLFLPAVIFAQKTQHIINYWDSAKSIKKEEGDLNNGKKNGLWISWDASGDTLQKNQYIDGKLHGKCISWMFGKGEYKYESNWDHGKAIGILKNFFRDSQNNDWHLSSTEEYAVSKDNDLTYKRWDDKGQLMAVQTYKDYKEGVIGNLIAIPEGKWFSWHENGQKRREEEYLNNSREGVWTTWHENGQKQHHIKYAIRK